MQVGEISNDKFQKRINKFFDAMLNKMFFTEEIQNMSISEKNKVAFEAGNELRNLIKKYTGVDTKEMIQHEHKAT